MVCIAKNQRENLKHNEKNQIFSPPSPTQVLFFSQKVVSYLHATPINDITFKM